MGPMEGIFFLFVWFLKDGKSYHMLSADKNDPVERKSDDEMGMGIQDSVL